MRRGRARFGAAWTLLVLALTIALGAAPAMALVIETPTTAIGPVNVTVRLDAGEPTGTVTLCDGATSVGETLTVDGLAAFPGLSLTSGAHTLHATLAGSVGGTWTSAPVLLYAWAAPGALIWTAPAATTVRSPARIRVKAGAATATMTLLVNGQTIRSVPCRPDQAVDLGLATLAKGVNDITVRRVSLSGETSDTTRSLRRKEWPYSTCIVVDKSQYRLYWIRNQQVVKYYPVAHGRYNWTPCRTWRILAKYRTDPGSVYGPRKMRLFKRAGSAGHYRWVFTKYAIHGTNQPWVIGTQASHGCIRMYNKDVLELWPQVPLGTYVITRP